MQSVKQEDIKYHFWVFAMNLPRIEPKSPRPLANTLPTWPKGQLLVLIPKNLNQQQVIDWLIDILLILAAYQLVLDHYLPSMVNGSNQKHLNERWRRNWSHYSNQTVEKIPTSLY